MNFDDEMKWCPCCRRYVRYLQSYDYSYCVHCGGKVHMFSKEDWEVFQRRIKRKDRSSK